MKILGISNPNYLGVTIATKAVCSDYLPLPDLKHTSQIVPVVKAILNEKPDVFVVGGWSKGYLELLSSLKKVRQFPVIGVHHGTPYHGDFFGDDALFRELMYCHDKSIMDILAFVHPQTARYYQVVKEKNAIFLPHWFEMQPKTVPEDFRIGVLGGCNFVKNSSGAAAVARDFAQRRAQCSVAAPPSYDLTHKAFIEILDKCAVLIQPSHLECYSNVMQEAWSRGIPVIYSPANNSLVEKNPFLTESEKDDLAELGLWCATDPLELYNRLDEVLDHQEHYSDTVHHIYKRLAQRTESYADTIFKSVAQGNFDMRLFAAPFQTAHYTNISTAAKSPVVTKTVTKTVY